MNAWIERYVTWSHEVYVCADSPTPTPQQAYVLRAIHFRVVKEEYEIAGEPIPEAVWRDKAPDIHVERHLFRLIHGLPGSGKSKLIAWLIQYLDEV